MYEHLRHILDRLICRDLSVLTTDNVIAVSNEAARLISKNEEWSDYDKACSDLIINISQIVYDNTDRDMLFLEDGVYDLLLEKSKIYNPIYQVGSTPIDFEVSGGMSTVSFESPMEFLDDDEFIETSLYYDEITKGVEPDSKLFDARRIADRKAPIKISKRKREVSHKYPKLAGTLDKCKFVMISEAMQYGISPDDPKVKIFERDFIHKHMDMGLYGPNDEIELVMELKYDGMAVEADVTDHIISARTRGDTAKDKAADLTPILGGYRFPYAPKMEESESFGMQFEAIMTYMALSRLSMLKGKKYKNCRNAIAGLFSSSDAANYRDLITLVPLATSLDVDPITEIEFMNKYYHSGIQMRYAIARGNYQDVLFQVYKFVKEAEICRPAVPFMYDGVVVHYTNPMFIKALGRVNSVNQYSMAIKFNPMVRQALFTGYSYTVGQNGVITPMIHYTPVEFFGGIHTKSSGHSYARFRELNLAYGNVLDITYRNDVMPYVTRNPDYVSNRMPEQFIQNCPACGMPLIFSDNAAFCPNKRCPGAMLARSTNMMKKLGIKGFAEASVVATNTYGLKALMESTYMALEPGGQAFAQNVLDQINRIKANPVKDYTMMGALGFTDIASEKWKKILQHVTLTEILYDAPNVLNNKLTAIKGIGIAIARTVCDERDLYRDDIMYIMNMPNIVFTTGQAPTGKKIRFSGFRDDDLVAYLQSLGHDASSEGGVTNDTDILLVPNPGYVSGKTMKAKPPTKIIDILSFKQDMKRFLM